MMELVPGTVDASLEKHVPVVTRLDECTIKVEVGAVAHPRTEIADHKAHSESTISHSFTWRQRMEVSVSISRIRQRRLYVYAMRSL